MPLLNYGKMKTLCFSGAANGTHHGFRCLHRLLCDLVISLADAKTHIPPDLEALSLERLGEDLGARLILAIVGKKDVWHA